ncbi:MAG: hypothetical protein OP8BY_0090 [Candidatus Saccharicenans subterraneus]|uniref:Uncharacterized protein n=1 Tax=Candidatus Saccharicenans subterraneus TaxID=2508984 RepID=A0A3E2BLT4_9BACT|nr:MAG: hypothetical protein OP8BY_0090 [Candidatus Saccharicenans subterraneum]
MRADTSTRATFSLELKEWLVLEIKSAHDGFSDTGNLQALGQAEVVLGQPVQVRALLSVSEGDTIALKGVIYSEEEPENQSLLIWRGQGDIQGEGLVLVGQENIYAVWQGNGLKTGSLVFLDREGNSGHVFKARFTLSAL